MTISNYADLQIAVASWLHPGGTSPVTSLIPDFITLAEAKLNRRLRLRAMETVATGSITASVSLPTDFLEIKSLTTTQGDATWKLEYCDPSEITGEATTSYKYTVIGANIKFPTVGSGQTYTLTYYAKLPALSAGANWLITHAPHVYLYAVLVEGCEYIQDTNRLTQYNQLLESAIEQLQTSERTDRYIGGLRVTKG